MEQDLNFQCNPLVQKQVEDESSESPQLIKKRQLTELNSIVTHKVVIAKADSFDGVQIKKKPKEKTESKLSISKFSKNSVSNDQIQIFSKSQLHSRNQNSNNQQAQKILESKTIEGKQEEEEEEKEKLAALQFKKRKHNKSASFENLQLKPQRNQSAYDNSKRFISQQS